MWKTRYIRTKYYYYCPENFLSATLKIPGSVSRWFSCIIQSCLLPVQAIDGCYALASKPGNLKVEVLHDILLSIKDSLLYELDLKGV